MSMIGIEKRDALGNMQGVKLWDNETRHKVLLWIRANISPQHWPMYNIALVDEDRDLSIAEFAVEAAIDYGKETRRALHEVRALKNELAAINEEQQSTTIHRHAS